MIESAGAALNRILKRLAISAEALMGRGGEALVYAVDAERVARIYHPGANPVTVEERAALLRQLSSSAHRVPFSIPEVMETHNFDGRMVTIERRLSGRPLHEVLGEAAGPRRVRLIHAYLDAAARIGDLSVARPWHGDLMGGNPIRTSTFREYLADRAARSLAAAGEKFAGVDPLALAAALPEPATGDLVHLDAFAGNMLTDGETVTAVVDFGVVAIVGDRRLDPLSAAAYLTPYITPTATNEDRQLAQRWLAERDLIDLFLPAQRWLAAFWSFAYNDEPLYEWCQSILLAEQGDPNG